MKRLNAYAVSRNNEVLNEEVDSVYLKIGADDMVSLSFDRNTGELCIHGNQWQLKRIATDPDAKDHNVNLTLIRTEDQS